jgi:acetate kinase
MSILALNCGSSSIKAAVLDGAPLARVIEARVEQIGTADATLRIDRDETSTAAPTIEAAVGTLLTALSRRLDNGTIAAVVHRVVHGGERFTRPTRIDDETLAALDALASLAPLHNPPAIVAIRAARREFGAVPHFAIFDTSFHRTLPPAAKEYALSLAVRERYGIRRFGFHGISHEHVMQRVAAQMRKSPRDLRIISCHLGNGASVAAIEAGASVETSMGMTPLEGLVMGTRAGDLDPGIVLELMRDHDRASLEELLTRKSGLVGLVGTNDMRDIDRRAAQGDAACRLALDIYVHRIRKYIGAYAATLGGVDAIAFTGGVGENNVTVRQRCLGRLDFLGVTLDENSNRAGLTQTSQGCVEISASGSRVRLFVLRADEELAMAEAIEPLLSRASANL